MTKKLRNSKKGLTLPPKEESFCPIAKETSGENVRLLSDDLDLIK